MRHDGLWHKIALFATVFALLACGGEGGEHGHHAQRWSSADAPADEVQSDGGELQMLAQTQHVKPSSDEAKPASTEVVGEARMPDHSGFDALLRRHVDARAGRVSYAGLKRDEGELDVYLAQLKAVDVKPLPRREVFALYLNAYNAFTLKLILERYPGLKSIRDYEEPWKQVRWELAGGKVSLDQLEHQMLRPTFKDPRIHFAVNCAAVGCPPLAAEAFLASTLERQLEAVTRRTIQDARHVEFKDGKLHLSEIFNWYGEDFTNEKFKGHTPTVAGYVARYARPEVARAIEGAKGSPPLAFKPYDWSLNAK